MKYLHVKDTQEIADTAEFRVQKITVPNLIYSKWGGLPDSENMSFKHAYKYREIQHFKSKIRVWDCLSMWNFTGLLQTFSAS